MPYYTVALSKSKVGPRRGAAPLASPVPQQTTGALQRLAGSVVEAGCLVAVLALPLYFTVLTSGYEPDKAVLLRALACITAVAWLAGLPGGRPARTRPGPLFWLSALLFLAYCLATVLSIQPTTSLWGLHNRQEGLWTRASYLIFLVAVVTRFRDRAQLDRLISVLLIGSVPVVLYGFIQEFRLDPVPTSGSPETLQWPVWSSFGQHVFFGSYLVFIIPFTLARVLSGWEGRSPVSSAWYGAREVAVGAGTLALMAAGYFAFLRLGVDHPALFAALAGLLAGYVLAALYLLGLPETPALRRARSVGYLGFLALQVLTLIFTGTRASWLGALAALPVFGFLVARRTHRARIARTILGATAAAGLFLLLLNIPNGPLKPLRTIHGLNRLANITDSGGSEGSAQGRLLIWQGVKDLVTTDPAVGGTWGGIGRSLIGYGPETMRVAFQRVFPLTLRRVNSEINVWDRAHDIYLDYLVDAGLVALLLLLAILAVFFWRVLRLLPAVPDRSAWLLIAAASAMVGHLVDGLFSIETVVSFLLFWLVIALVAGDGLRADGAPEAAPAFGRPAAVFAVALAALMAALLAVSTADSPALLGILWLLAVVMGIAAVARSLAGATLPATGLPGVSLPIGGVVPALR
ncbi:MAG: O-antigen ligase family protein, partial [Chloroflexi bacterium]|nr:O-antigen ligase family protein [Chloroflexota bacterium]